jgi:hypothetical protein
VNRVPVDLPEEDAGDWIRAMMLYTVNFIHLMGHSYIEIVRDIIMQPSVPKDDVLYEVVRLFGKDTNDINFLADSVVHADLDGTLNIIFNLQQTWTTMKDIIMPKMLSSYLTIYQCDDTNLAHKHVEQYAFQMASTVLNASPYIQTYGETYILERLRSGITKYASADLETAYAWTLVDYLAWYIYHSVYHILFHLPIPAITPYFFDGSVVKHPFAIAAYVPGHNCPLESIDFCLTTTETTCAKQLNALTYQLCTRIAETKESVVPDLQFLYDTQFWTWSAAS